MKKNLTLLFVMVFVVTANAQNGIIKGYYVSGNLKPETTYIKGKKNGVEKSYWSNGRLQNTTNYSRILQDDIANQIYLIPTPAHNKNETFVGRLRRDDREVNFLNCWVVSDNLRKGAATNAVQISEVLVEKGFIG